MKKLYLLWLVLFLGLCILGILLPGAGLGPFIHFPSLVIVLGPALIMSLSNFSSPEISRYFALGFSKAETNSGELKNGFLYFSALQRYIICSGLIGTFIGLVSMLAVIEDKSLIGGAMSMVLLTILYALILNVGVVVPFKTGLQKRLNAFESGTGGQN